MGDLGSDVETLIPVKPPLRSSPPVESKHEFPLRLCNLGI